MKEIYEKLLQGIDSYTKEKELWGKLLTEARAGNKEARQYLKMLLENRSLWGCLEVLLPEDKEWLKDADDVMFDALILLGMFYSFRTWEEPFVDEESNEKVQICRYEILNTSIFPFNAEECQRLFKKICSLNYNGCEATFKSIFEILKYASIYYPYYPDLDYTLYLKALEEKYPSMQWLCEEFGDIYRWGCEHWGYFIDKQKAKEYYDKVGDYDYDPEEDEDDTNPISATLTIKGDATELKSVIEEYAEMPDNEFGIYAPINKLMNLFVGSNLKCYKGNVLFVNEEDGALIITVEMNNSSYPFKYAIERRYPTLEVMVDE